MSTSNWTSTVCDRCPALAACRRQVVISSPPPPRGLLAIGEAPGADEDIKGEGFVGKAGQTLTRLLAVHGLGRQDFGRANICRCRPPENRRPKTPEVSACLPYLADLILAFKPKVLLLVGGTATEPFLGKGTLTEQITQAQRNSLNDLQQGHPVLRQALAGYLAEHGGIYCVPMPHTSPLAFNRNAPSGVKWSVVAEQQIASAIRLLG